MSVNPRIIALPILCASVLVGIANPAWSAEKKTEKQVLNEQTAKLISSAPKDRAAAKNSSPTRGTQSSDAHLNAVTGNGVEFAPTPDIQKPEKNHGVLDVDKIDFFKGGLRVNHEDVRLKSTGFDIVVRRNYAPNTTYSGLVYPWRGNKPHPWSNLGLGRGWSIAVAPRVIISGNGKVELMKDRLCSKEMWRISPSQMYRGPAYELLYVYSDGSGNNSYEPEALQYITSYVLEMEDGQVEQLVPFAQGEVRSAGGWRMTCDNNQYTLASPNGRQYLLGQTSKWTAVNEYYNVNVNWARLLQATRVNDSNGNEHIIEYQNDWYPSKVATADGAVSIQLKYDPIEEYPGYTNYIISSIVDNNGREWKYRVEIEPESSIIVHERDPVFQMDFNQNNYNDGLGAAPGVAIKLLEVSDPEGRAWRYEYWDRFVTNNANMSACLGGPFGWNTIFGPVDNTSPMCQGGARSGLLKQLTFPEGGSVSYDYGYFVHGFTPAWPWEYYFDEQLKWDVEWGSTDSGQRRLSYSSRIKTRTLSTGEQWQYAYPLQSALGEYDRTVVITPDTTETYDFIGGSYIGKQWVDGANNSQFPYAAVGVWQVGLLAKKTVGDLYVEQNEWAPLSFANWPDRASTPMLVSDKVTNRAVLTRRTITQDGAAYVKTFSNWDAYGNPQTVAESGPNGGQRTTSVTYFNSPVKWIIGKPKNEVSSSNSLLREFDGNGNLLSQNENGVVTQHTYDTRGNLTSKTLPRGLVHSYANYKRGIAQSEVQPEGVTLTRVVDDNGNIASETNGEGHVTRYTYDGVNRITSVTHPAGNVRYVAYGPNQRTTTRGTLTEQVSYDGFGRPSQINLGGVAVIYEYDAFGRLVYESNPNAPAFGTRNSFDPLGRVTKVQNADGSEQRRYYGAASTAIVDERGYTTTSTFRAYGDPMPQFLVSVSAPDPAANLSITLNGRNQVSAITQDGLTRTYGYDDAGYLTTVINPETGMTVYSRDQAGNMTARKIGSSGTATFEYDGQNRLVRSTFPGVATAITNTYNKLGKIVSSIASGGTRTYSYDANGNLAQESLLLDGYNFTATYGYNGNDQLSWIKYPLTGQVVQYEPDALGRPSKVGPYLTSVAYHPSGQIAELFYANGTVSQYAQNMRLWPAGFSAGTSAGQFWTDSKYAYDTVGNLTSIRDANVPSYNRDLSYDGLNRLVRADGTWGTGLFEYSGSGNITKQNYGNTVQLYGYSANRLANVSGNRSSTFNYDELGNVTGAWGQAYQYDGASNLICSACGNPSNRIDYTYDATGRRSSVSKRSGTAGAAVKRYEMYATNGDLLIEYTPSNRKTIEHIYLGGKRIAQRETP